MPRLAGLNFACTVLCFVSILYACIVNFSSDKVLIKEFYYYYYYYYTRAHQEMIPERDGTYHLIL